MSQQAVNGTLTEFVVLKATTCWCGVVHAVSESFLKQCRDGKQPIFCPVGHRGDFKGEEENARLRRQLEAANRDIEHKARRLREEAEAANRLMRSNRALRGAAKRTKAKAVAGMCPVADCHRHFTNLERHMGTKHPGFQAQDIA